MGRCPWWDRIPADRGMSCVQAKEVLEMTLRCPWRWAYRLIGMMAISGVLGEGFRRTMLGILVTVLLL